MASSGRLPDGVTVVTPMVFRWATVCVMLADDCAHTGRHELNTTKRTSPYDRKDGDFTTAPITIAANARVRRGPAAYLCHSGRTGNCRLYNDRAISGVLGHVCGVGPVRRCGVRGGRLARSREAVKQPLTPSVKRVASGPPMVIRCPRFTRPSYVICT